jgi:murein DD-endopeptidase MepM/ murein hydrolase activator NlpD
MISRHILALIGAGMCLCGAVTVLVASGRMHVSRPTQADEIVKVYYQGSDQENYVVRASYHPPRPLPVTLTVSFDLVNMTPDRPVPLTVVLRQAGEFDLVHISRKVLSASWRFNYDFRWKYGDRDAFLSDRPYRLPYSSGEAAVVRQGFHGAFNHRGAEEYSIDFAMPTGTPVLAARAGRVIETRDDVAQAVRSLPVGQPVDIPTNAVYILHDDGTVGRYLHFRLHGVQVSAGQYVRTGDLIGYSGDTGLSTEPHLHFDVYKPVDGYTLQTVPIRFEVAGEPEPIELEEGRSYEAR